MVKTKAPLLSLGASGAIGGVLVASSSRGRTYMKKLTIPLNPNTPAQIGVRTMLRFLSQHWSTLATSQKATWEPLAAQQLITPMDAYVQDGLNRWSTGKFPGQTYPVDQSGGTTTMTAPAAYQQGRGAVVSAVVGAFQPAATIATYHSLSPGFTPHYTNAVHFQDSPADGGYSWLHTPLEPGWHYYKQFTFTRTGKPYPTPTDSSIQIT